MSKMTFTRTLSDDESDEFDKRMEALFGAGESGKTAYERNAVSSTPDHSAGDGIETFGAVGVSEYAIVAAEADRSIVKSAYQRRISLLRVVNTIRWQKKPTPNCRLML